MRKTVVLISLLLLIFLLSYFLFAKIKNINLNKPSKTSVSQPTAITSPKKYLNIRGAIPYWDQDNAYDSFKNNVSAFDYVSLFWYYLTNDGEIKKYRAAKEDFSIIDFAHQNNVLVSAVITNLPEASGADWDSERVENMLEDRDSFTKHIQNIVNLLKSKNFDGVIIDYEKVDKSQKDNFSRFIKELSYALHQEEKYLEVALHPKTSENNPTENNGSRSQDWKELAKYADHLFIMTYGEHWEESDAGPAASIPWVKKIINYSKELGLPADKIFLGVPLYGYDWNKDREVKARGLTYLEVQKIIDSFNASEMWNEDYSSPYISYEVNENNHEVWYENTASVSEKLLLAQNAGFKGVTFWRLGGEDSNIWSVIKNYTRNKP